MSEDFEARMSKLYALMRARSERNHRVRLAATNRDWNAFSRLTAEVLADAGGTSLGEDSSPSGTDRVGVDPPGDEGG